MAPVSGNSGIALGRMLLILLVLCAADAHAAGDGLLGTYYDQNGQAGQYFTGNTVVRVDPTVNFNWGSGSLASGIGSDNFSVCWTGEVEAPSSGSYTFTTRSDDGVRACRCSGHRLILPPKAACNGRPSGAGRRHPLFLAGKLYPERRG